MLLTFILFNNLVVNHRCLRCLRHLDLVIGRLVWARLRGLSVLQLEILLLELSADKLCELLAIHISLSSALEDI